jgi:hypothetical protein
MTNSREGAEAQSWSRSATVATAVASATSNTTISTRRTPPTLPLRPDQLLLADRLLLTRLPDASRSKSLLLSPYRSRT